MGSMLARVGRGRRRAAAGTYPPLNTAPAAGDATTATAGADATGWTTVLQFGRAPESDLPLGGVVLAVFLLGYAALVPGAGPIRAVDVVLALVTVAAVAVCRRYPLVALSVVTATMLAFHVRVHAGVAAAFAVLGVVYVAAWRGHRVGGRAGQPGLPRRLPGPRHLDAATSDWPGQQIVERTSLMLGWFVAANVAGVVARQRQAYLEQVEQRGDRGRTHPRGGGPTPRPNRSGLRIARDLHDSLTHSISLIKGAGRHRRASGPQARRACGGRVAGDPGGQQRRRCGNCARRWTFCARPLMRTVSDWPGSASSPSEPWRPAHQCGLPSPVSLATLPVEIDQAGYRVVQEALINAARHAGPGHRPDPSPVRPGATDRFGDRRRPGRPPPGPVTPGVGLRGMAERVNGTGGHAGTRPRATVVDSRCWPRSRWTTPA